MGDPMTQRAIDSQATAKAMIDHYIRLGAVTVEKRNDAEKLRKAVERGSRAHQRQERSGRRAWKPVE
jgi:hypothetical protein